ncbi:hypothetical protein [Alsobacter sp. R-9]
MFGTKGDAVASKDRMGWVGVAVAGAALVVTAAAAMAQETTIGIIADHIRNQGYACKTPESATRDAQASKPNEAVWILKCDGVSYRVRLVPDMAAKVEKIS